MKKDFDFDDNQVYGEINLRKFHSAVVFWFAQSYTFLWK